MIEVELNQQQLDAVHQMMFAMKNNGPKLLRTATNKGIDRAQTLAIGAITEKANLTKTNVRARTVKKKLGPAGFNGYLKVLRGRFGIEQFRRTNFAKSGTKFTLWNDEPRETYRHTFRFGNTGGTYERRLDGDGLRRKWGPSAAAIFQHTPGLEKRVANDSMTYAQSELTRLLDAQVFK